MKAVLFWLIMLLSLLSGCAAYQSYEELEAEAKITGDTTAIDKRDAQAEEATAYFTAKAECLQANGMSWMCTRATGSRITNKTDTIDGLIRAHRREKMSNCRCMSSGAAKDTMRQIGVY